MSSYDNVLMWVGALCFFRIVDYLFHKAAKDKVAREEALKNG